MAPNQVNGFMVKRARAKPLGYAKPPVLGHDFTGDWPDVQKVATISVTTASFVTPARKVEG